MKRYFKVLQADSVKRLVGLELEYVRESMLEGHVVLKQPENTGLVTFKLDYTEEVFYDKSD
jgi:hypothetical protein